MSSIRCRVDTDHPVTLPGQLTGDQPSTAAEIDYGGGAQLCGQLSIEPGLGVGGVRVERVVDRDQPRVGELGRDERDSNLTRPRHVPPVKIGPGDEVSQNGVAVGSSARP